MGVLHRDVGRSDHVVVDQRRLHCVQRRAVRRYARQAIMHTLCLLSGSSLGDRWSGCRYSHSDRHAEQGFVFLSHGSVLVVVVRIDVCGNH